MVSSAPLPAAQTLYPSTSPLVLICADAAFNDLFHLRHLHLVKAVRLSALVEGVA